MLTAELHDFDPAIGRPLTITQLSHSIIKKAGKASPEIELSGIYLRQVMKGFEYEYPSLFEPKALSEKEASHYLSCFI